MMMFGISILSNSTTRTQKNELNGRFESEFLPQGVVAGSFGNSLLVHNRCSYNLSNRGCWVKPGSSYNLTTTELVIDIVVLNV